MYGLEIDMRGFSSVFPPTTNCNIVNICLDRIERCLSPGVQEVPDNRNKKLKEILKKFGKANLKGLLEEYGKGSMCAHMNYDRCNGDMSQPIWPSDCKKKKASCKKKEPKKYSPYDICGKCVGNNYNCLLRGGNLCINRD